MDSWQFPAWPENIAPLPGAMRLFHAWAHIYILNQGWCLNCDRANNTLSVCFYLAVPLVDEGYVREMSYSPLLGGFTVVLSDGRAAFLVAGTLKFDPNSVQVNIL